MSFTGSKASAGVWHKLHNLVPPHNRLIVGFAGKGGDNLLRSSAADVAIGFEISEKTIAEYWPDFTGPVQPVSPLANIAGNTGRCSYTSGGKEILNYDFLMWLAAAAATLQSDDFIYADPPYPVSVVPKIKDYYEHVLSENDHVAMLDHFLASRSKVLVSTYDNRLYSSRLRSWNKESFPAMTRAGVATETVYYNYDKPNALQSYTVFGAHNTQRQQLKRLAQRWRQRLVKFDPLTRDFLIREMAALGTKNIYASDRKSKRVCKYLKCHQEFTPTRDDKEFCSTNCRVKYNQFWKRKAKSE